MKITTMGSVAGAVILAGSLSWTQAEEVKKPDKPEAAREDETTSRSTRESIIRRFDKDGDGKLNDEEKQVVRKALASREQEEREDDRGEGSSSSRRKRLMKAFDRNEDGNLDEEEREAARKAITSRISRSSSSRDEKDRQDEIVVPKDYDPKRKYPFILSLHGFGSSSRGQLGFFPLGDLAEKHDFIYCAPDGIDRSWNATDACCDWRKRVDDSSYLRGIIVSAMEKYNVDRKKIYVTGLSNGGFMSYRMAHDHSDLITAIVPFAGVGYKDWPGNPDNPVSVLHIHGTRDRTVKWKGGDIAISSYPSAEENFKKWRAFNNCDREIDTNGVKVDLTRKVPGEETKITRFENKDGSVTTELWEVVDGSHVTPPTTEAREMIVQWLLSKSKP